MTVNIYYNEKYFDVFGVKSWWTIKTQDAKDVARLDRAAEFGEEFKKQLLIDKEKTPKRQDINWDRAQACINISERCTDDSRP